MFASLMTICATGRHRARRRGRSVTGLALTERVHVIAVTDARTHRAHLVTDDAAVAGRHAGRYSAVCGRDPR